MDVRQQFKQTQNKQAVMQYSVADFYMLIILFSVQQLQHIPIEMGSPIMQCSVADPYVLIMSDEGQLMMLTLKQDAQGGRLVLSKPLVAAVSYLTS